METHANGCAFWIRLCSSVCRSFRPSVLSQIGSSIFLFFSFFGMNFQSHKVRKVTDPDFWRLNGNVEGGPKNPKIGSIMSPFIWFFLIQNEKAVFSLCEKTGYLRKIWFLSCGPKTSGPVRIQKSLNHSNSQTSRAMKLNCCKGRGIHTATDIMSH